MKRLIVLIATLLCLAVPASAAAAAFSPLGDACTAQGNTASACSANGTNPISGPNGILKKVTLIIGTVAGIVAVIIIIIAGFQYVVSNGDSQKTANARSAIIGAGIGLLIIVSATGILTFVISKT